MANAKNSSEGVAASARLALRRTARDLMTPAPIVVTSRHSLAELDALLVAENISGAPVVDDEALVGVVSRSDVIRALANETLLAEDLLDGYYLDPHAGVSARWMHLDALEVAAERLSHARVEDIMSSRLITVSPDDIASQVAKTMVRYRVHRVLVTEGHRLCGIVSSLDVVQLVAEPQHVKSLTASPTLEEIACYTPDMELRECDLLPGDCSVATLRSDVRTGATTLLVKISPGGSIAAHDLGETVEHFVLSGSYESHGVGYRAGTYRQIFGEVPEITSATGATILVTSPGALA